MRKISSIIKMLLITILALLLVGCSKEHVAVVNGDKITKIEFERNLKQLKDSYPDIEPAALRNYLLEDMIIDKVLLQEAIKNNITISSTLIEEHYNILLGDYKSEEEMLSALKEFEYTKEQLLEDIKEQLIIQKYLSDIKDIDSHIEDLVKKAQIQK